MRTLPLASACAALWIACPGAFGQAPCIIHDLNKVGSSSPQGIASLWGERVIALAMNYKRQMQPWVGRPGAVRQLKEIPWSSPFPPPPPPPPGVSARVFETAWIRSASSAEALVFFRALDTNLWKSDGTTAGTSLVKKVTLAFGQAPVAMRGKVYFSANDRTAGYELWVSDGTNAGTKILKNIRAGSSSASPLNFVRCENKLYFSADDGVHGRELWVSDGTANGTRMVKDVRSGQASSGARPLLCHRGKLYFTASDAATGSEVWISDGTSAGTVLLADIHKGPNSSNVFSLSALGDDVFFFAHDGARGQELWKTDGTRKGTTLVKDIYAGSGSSVASVFQKLALCDGKLYFPARDDKHGIELWSTDGTSAGTKLVKDINPGQVSAFSASSFRPVEFRCVGDRIYFAAAITGAKATGTEPFVSDGTASGTKILCDLMPGATSSSPSEFTVAAGSLFMAANTPTRGRELIEFPLSRAHTQRLGDPTPESLSASTPKLGSTLRITGEGGPSQSVGVALLSSPVLRPYRVQPDSPSYIDLQSVVQLGTVTAPTFRLNLTVPNDKSLTKARLNLQAWWVDAKALFPIRTTNAVQLALGN